MYQVSGATELKPRGLRYSSFPEQDSTWRYCLSAFFLVLIACGGCGPTPDEAVGRNVELEKQRDKKDAEITALRAQLRELEAQNERLKVQHAAATGAKGLGIEERQQLLDDRKVALDERENDLALMEQFVEATLSKRKDELEAEYASRLKDVMARETEITQKEADFYQRTNLTMEEIGAAKEVRSEFENMRSARDAAAAKAEDWLQFLWYVSIALGIAILISAILAVVTASKHLTSQRELANRQEVARLLSRAIEAQLPPEQGAIVADAFNRLTRIEDRRATSGGEALPAT